MVGGVGRREFGGVEHEHPGDIDRDIAVADHDCAAPVEVELMIGVERVAVVPSHEFGRRMRSGTVLAGDTEALVGRGPQGVDHGVVALAQVFPGDVGAQLDAAEESKRLVARGLGVDARHRLDLRVIRRHPGANEAIRRRQRVEQVDVKPGLQQLIGRVETGRAGSDDRCASGHDLRVLGAHAHICAMASASRRTPSVIAPSLKFE